MMINSKKLIAWQSAPGLSTIEETKEILNFLNEFNEMYVTYKNAFNDPVGMSVQSLIDKAEWYVNYHKGRE